MHPNEFKLVSPALDPKSPKCFPTRDMMTISASPLTAAHRDALAGQVRRQLDLLGPVPA